MEGDYSSPIINSSMPEPPPQVLIQQPGLQPNSPKAGLVLLAVGVLGVLILVFLGVVYGIQKMNNGSGPTNRALDSSFSRIAKAFGEGEDSTPYINSRYGVSATLPGNNWDRPVPWTSGRAGESIWRSDGKAHFGFMVWPSSVSPSDWVAHHRIGFEKTPSPTITNTTYKGHEAIKVEADADYKTGLLWREVIYIFRANDQTYAVDAGTRADEWEKGGKDFVSSMLDSVTISRQTVVLDSTPTPDRTPTP